MLGASPSWANSFTGPTSPYYLSDVFDPSNDGPASLANSIYIVRGTSVITNFRWSYGTYCNNSCEGTLAVTTVVSTNRVGSGEDGCCFALAGQYAGNSTLLNSSTGTSWTGTPPLPGEVANVFYDGTSDGTHNYTVEVASYTGTGFGPINVIATDLNWQNPVSLFTIPGATINSYSGVTYDPTNNSLWISGYDTDVIADYSLTGTLLSSFTTGLDQMNALAFDPADGTLWFIYAQSNLLYQYSTAGELLQSGTPRWLPQCCLLSGEFAEAGPAVPLPAALPLFAGGLGVMAWMARRRKRKAAAEA